MTQSPLKPSLKALVEALIFASESPLSFREIKRILAEEAGAVPPITSGHRPREGEAPAEFTSAGGGDASPHLWSDKEIKDELEALIARYAADDTSGFYVAEVAGAYHFRSKTQFAPYVRLLYKEKPHRLSRSSLETVSIIAYRQPVTRAEIDEIRGVDSSAAMRTLLERGLIRVLGHSDDPGHPGLYGTTPLFLETFTLNGLEDLPPLETPEQVAADLSVMSGNGGGNISSGEGGDRPQAREFPSESDDGSAVRASSLGAAEKELVRLAEETELDSTLIEELEREMLKVSVVQGQVMAQAAPSKEDAPAVSSTQSVDAAHSPELPPELSNDVPTS